MANYANLLAQIAANIYSNNNQDITGDALKLQLNAMVASLGAGYQFMGVAHPADTPSGYADLRAFWLAGEAGTYTNFDGLVLADGEVAVIKYDGNGWSKDVTGAASTAQVDELDQEINLKLYGVSEINKNIVWSDGFVAGSTGKVTASSNYQFSQPVLLKAGEKITYNTAESFNKAIVQVADNSPVNIGDTLTGTVILNYTTPGQSRSYTATQDIYIVITVRKSSYDVTFFEYADNSISERIVTLGEKVDGKAEDRIGTNIVNPAEVESGYLNSSGNVDSSVPTLNVTGFIPVSSGQSITAFAKTSSSPSILCFAAYNNKKVFLRGLTNTATYTQQGDEVFVRMTLLAPNAQYPTLYANYGSSLLGYEPYQSVNDAVEANKNSINSILETLTLDKFRGGLLNIASSVDSSCVSAIVGDGNTDITIKQLIYSRRTVPSGTSFYYPPQATLSIPQTENVVTIGVIYNPSSSGQNAARYGWFSSAGNYSPIADNERFDPILVCIVYGTTFELRGGLLYDAIRIAEQGAEIAQIAGRIESTRRPTNIVYENHFNNIQGFGACSLSDGSVVSPSSALTITQDGVTILQDCIVWPLINTRMNNNHTRILINTGVATSFVLRAYGMENGAQGITRLADIDITNGTIKLMTNSPVSYQFAQNRDYLFDVHRIDKKIVLSVLDVKTGTKTEVSSWEGVTSGNDGYLYDIVAIGSNSSPSIVVKSYIVESGVNSPKLMFYGDSITAGFFATVVGGENPNCYAALVGDASGMNWLSSARGGGSASGLLGGNDNLGYTYQGRLLVELPRLLPDYVMVTIGTNGGLSYNSYKQIIDKILEIGATPILNTLPIRADGDGEHNQDYIVSSNQAILQIWKDYNISGARLDLATSLNNDGDTINTSLYYNDLIHPNDLGHQALYNRILSDCPFLFYLGN